MSHLPTEHASIVLRGHMVSLGSEIGKSFVGDCARYTEGLMSEVETRSRWGLTEQQWEAFERHTPILDAVQHERERRIMNGTAVAEAARRQHVNAPAVLGSILSNDGVSPRHRIEAARELRTMAVNSAGAGTQNGEKFTVTINIGKDESLVFAKDRLQNNQIIGSKEDEQ
jgi:hypothetical protein